jgi:hypothetical protein
MFFLTVVQLVLAPEGSVVGERVTFPSYPGNPEPENKLAKKKLFEKIAPFLSTDQEGNAVYKGEKGGSIFTTSAGVCKAEKGMVGGHVS